MLRTPEARGRAPLPETPGPGRKLPLDPVRQAGCKHERCNSRYGRKLGSGRNWRRPAEGRWGGQGRGSFGAKPRHRRGWERPGLPSGSLQGRGAGGGSPLKSERGAAEQSCAHRGPAPGSVGGSGYSLMWPWQGCRPHVLQLPVPMLGSQQSLLPSTRGWGSGWGGADLHVRLATGCRDGSPAWRQRPRAGASSLCRHPQPPLP